MPTISSTGVRWFSSRLQFVRLIALRHGQSEYNLLGLCNDSVVDSVPLTPLGVEQATAAGRQLVGHDIDVLYCSPLQRTRETAAIVAQYAGLFPVVDGRLADIRSGFNGRPVADYLAAIAADPVDASVAGGESLREYRARVNGFLDELRLQELAGVVLVVHEETLRVLRSVCHGDELADVAGRAYQHCVPYEFQLESSNR